MNQHSQGGSSLQMGSVELMQNRRLLADDNKGVNEALNETQADGRGIAVNTKYFVSFTDLTSQESVQRKTQLLTDEPIQFFYATDFTITAANGGKTSEHLSAMASLLTDFDGDLKLLQFPEDRNQVLLRLANLADLYDGAPATTPQFNLQEYALQLYKHANNGAAPASMTITERTLSNNQDYEQMKLHKFHWKSYSSENALYAVDAEDDAIIAL